MKFLGHIKSTMGVDELEIQQEGVRTSELIELLRSRAKTDPRLGFTRFNTLIVVNDGEVFSASADDRVLNDGDSVTLLPFSHGG